MKTSYVYEILVDGLVRYVGKGTGSRVTLHRRTADNINRRRLRGEKVTALKFHNKLARALIDGAEVTHRIVVGGLSSQEALSREVVAIASWPTGQLWNEHAGGTGADSEYMKGIWRDPAWREKQTQSLQAKWDDPKYREKMSRIRSDPEVRRKISQTVKNIFSDPEQRRLQSERITAAHRNNPELAKAQGETVSSNWSVNYERYKRAVTAHWDDPSQRKRQSDAAKAAWADPDNRKRFSESLRISWSDPEKRKRQSEAIKKAWENPTLRAKMALAAKTRKRGHKMSAETREKMSLARSNYYRVKRLEDAASEGKSSVS